MRLILLGVTLAVLACPGPVARAAPAAAERSALEGWIAAQRDTQRIVVELRQERWLKGLRKPFTNPGRLWLDRRGRMRWQIGEPPKTIAVYRDREVVVMRTDRKTVEKRTLAATGDQQGELERVFLFSGLPDSVARIEESFKIGETTRRDGIATVRLTPRSARTATVLVAVDLLIDEAKHQLTGYDVSCRDGSSIRTRFLSVVVNPPADDSVYSPDLAGYKVQESPPSR